VENKDIFPVRLVSRCVVPLCPVEFPAAGNRESSQPMQGYDPIARRRKVLEYRVQNMERLVATLRAAADLEKNNPCHGMHWKLKVAMQTLAKRKAELNTFYFENPTALGVYATENSAWINRFSTCQTS
jgi:hypothetical protein